jgi:hypothetical protein
MSIRMAKALSSAPHRPPPMTIIEKMDRDRFETPFLRLNARSQVRWIEIGDLR